MSRFRDHYDDDSPEAVLAAGRWQRNARAALKGRRGRQALRDLREALLALPEPRLIEGAVCTVGGIDAHLPPISAEERAERIARDTAAGYAEFAERWADQNDQWREAAREALRDDIEEQGEGCCGIGAYIWYQKVKAGMDPAEAFAAVPLAHTEDGDDGLEETGRLGEQAGLTFTLAWELAYRNDETYKAMTPEERWTAFVAWIDAELAGDQAVKAGAAA